MIARTKPTTVSQWNPEIHSGYFYFNEEEYFHYATEKVQEASVSPTTLAVELDVVPLHGAPIIAQSKSNPVLQFRKVSFMDGSAPTLTYHERCMGNGTNELYVTYPDIENLQVVEDGQPITGVTVNDNCLTKATAWEFGKYYDISYTLNCSFYLFYKNGKAYLRFDKAYNDLIIYYEVNDINNFRFADEVSPIPL